MAPFRISIWLEKTKHKPIYWLVFCVALFLKSLKTMRRKAERVAGEAWLSERQHEAVSLEGVPKRHSVEGRGRAAVRSGWADHEDPDHDEQEHRLRRQCREPIAKRHQ